MRAATRSLQAMAMFLAVGSSQLHAQVLHINDRWEECAIVIDPSLSQEAWHQFVREVGLVAYFRPLTSARPLGAKHVEFALLQWATRIDDADAAWNDTFSHPDSMHWLFDGDALAIPGLMLRAGVSDRVDVGAYITKSIGANYGIAGAQVQYNLLDDAARQLAAAGRASFSALYGPEDMSVAVYGVDFLVSKGLSVFTPYAGVSGYLTRGRERTSKVDLENESVFGVQGMAGVTVSIWAARLGAEVSLARVPGYAFKIAFGS